MRNQKATNFLGRRGEAVFVEKVMGFCDNGMPYFDAHFLWDKFPVFNFLVTF